MYKIHFTNTKTATFGGIASITFGASFISIVEIIYFFTGRFGAKLLRYVRQRQRPTKFKLGLD